MLQSASSSSDQHPGSPRILISRLSAIGDCILTMPLACALKERFSRAFVAWGVQGASASLLEKHPCVDLAIRVSKQDLRSPAALWRLRRRLRGLRFDVALDPQGLTKSSLVAWLSGARRRIGFARPVGREISPWLQTELVQSRREHVVERYLELLGPLGVEAPSVRFNFPRDATAAAVMTEYLELHPNLQRGFAVINPGAGWDSKLWPAERFEEVAIHLSRRHGLPTVAVWAGDRERLWAEQIVRQATGCAVLAPKTSLLELGELLRHARLFVGSDTGPLHMAAAVGVPCVGIYGPTRPEECGPYGQGHKTVQSFYQAGTSRQRRNAANEAMRAVSASQVCNACDDLISSGARAAFIARKDAFPDAA